MRIIHYGFYMTLLCSTMSMISCTVGPDFTPPPAPMVTEYTATPLATEYFKIHQDIPARWWEVFHSEPLSAMIAEGLANSPTLVKAQATLKQAQEEYNVQFGSLFPTVDANLSVTREQVNLQSFGINIPNPPPFTLYNIGVSVAYTLDFFGANRRQLEALCAMVHYQTFEMIASQLTLAANITTAAIQHASLQAQVNTRKSIIDLQQKQFDIMEQRHQVGGVATLDLSAQKELLLQNQALLSPLQKQQELARHQLAMYMGKLPADPIPQICLSDITLPHTLPLSLPSQLLEQRPDIQAATALLHQASANIGVATANLFPQIQITGSLATEATKISNLFGRGSSAWSIGPGLVQPLFHGGSLFAKRRAAIAAFEQAQAAYQETVLQGFQNVADTLKAIEYDAHTYQLNTQSAMEAEKVYTITLQQYQIGAVSHFALLDAQRQYQEALLNQIKAQADRLLDAAALFQALGGGW